MLAARTSSESKKMINFPIEFCIPKFLQYGAPAFLSGIISFILSQVD